ncbi:MAG: DUF192 domain-containing protein [Rhizobiaceae bacterium]|nr:DUF192 domain-containing protein [Rhizobiaceae bacterium]
MIQKVSKLIAVATATILVGAGGALADPGHARGNSQPLPRPTQVLTQKLDSESLSIVTGRGKFDFSVEIADEPQERQIGLMNREKMDPRSGMLFQFERRDVVTMWMKNTLIPLDMIFITQDGKVATVAERTTPHSLDVISSKVPVRYVLELNGGMAAFIGIKPGDDIEHRFFK